MQLIVLLSWAVYWGKIFFVYVFPLAMLYGIYFTFLPRQLLGYEFEEKQYNIFPPGPVFFLLVTEKLVKKSMGERKMYFFPISIFFPHGPMLYLVLRCMKMMIFFFCIFFGGLECVGHSFAYVAHL